MNAKQKVIQVVMLSLLIFITNLLHAETSNQQIKFFGAVEVVYCNEFSRSDVDQTFDRFYLKAGNVGFKGKLFPKISYRVLYIIDKSYTISPYDVYICINPIPSINVYLGQFAPPFGFERLTSSTKRDFINNANATGLINSRDLGLQLEYANKYLIFNAALLNGVGLNSSEKDDYKGVVGRLVFNVLKTLKFGGATYYEREKQDSITVKKQYFNLQGDFKSNVFHVLSEYVYYKENDIKSYDYYFQMGVKFHLKNIYPKEYEILFRYEYFDENTTLSNDDQRILTWGLNIFFGGYKLISKINYRKVMNHNNDSIDNLLLSLQLLF